MEALYEEEPGTIYSLVKACTYVLTGCTCFLNANAAKNLPTLP